MLSHSCPLAPPTLSLYLLPPSPVNTILNEHGAAEDQHLKPLYQQGHTTSENKATEATLSKFDQIAHSFTPLLLGMRQQAAQLKEFVEALQAHDTYETSTLLPQLDARLPTAERDSLLAAMRAKSAAAKPQLKSVDRAASGGATGGMPTTSTGTGQPSFVGPDYVRASATNTPTGCPAYAFLLTPQLCPLPPLHHFSPLPSEHLAHSPVPPLPLKKPLGP